MGESVFLGNIPCIEKPIEDFYKDNFILKAQIVEIKDKPSVPRGNVGISNSFGEAPTTFIDKGIRKRALISLGKQDINIKGRELLGINDPRAKGRHAKDFFNLVDFMIAYNEKRNVKVEKMFVPSTGKYVDILITYLKDQNMLFGILIDVSNQVNYDNEINKVKMETLKTTDEVIKKQMRVAQEIASLLGETTAETKVALLKLKKTLSDEHIEKGNK